MRRGAVLLEVIIAVVVITLAAVPLFVTIVSERALSSYALAHLTAISLAQSKMADIEGKLRVNPDYYGVNKYYGFQYDPGSSDDINHDPSLPQYQQDQGTFFKEGLPEYRYQFYITNDGNGKFVHLLVWRRPNVSGGLIVKTYLYEEVYQNDF